MTNYAVDRADWAKLDIFNQMGNIYSEVGRSFKSMNQTTSEEHIRSVARAIDLFDATIDSLIKSHSPKSKEVLRAKEQYLDLVIGNDPDQQAIKDLDKYFIQFAVAARLKTTK